jgi:hypothetical protein
MPSSATSTSAVPTPHAAATVAGWGCTRDEHPLKDVELNNVRGTGNAEEQQPEPTAAVEPGTGGGA